MLNSAYEPLCPVRLPYKDRQRYIAVSDLPSPDCVHEGMPFEHETHRTFLRIALPVGFVRPTTATAVAVSRATA